jgi:hypothetical protein
MAQKSPQTEFVCKRYGWSKFKSTRSKVKVKGVKVTRVTTARVTHGDDVATPQGATWHDHMLTGKVMWQSYKLHGLIVCQHMARIDQ